MAEYRSCCLDPRRLATLRRRFCLLRPANGHYRQRHQHQHLRRKSDGEHQWRLPCDSTALEPETNWFDTTVFSQPTGCTGAVGTACPLVYGTSIGNVSRERVPRTGIHSEQRFTVQDLCPARKLGARGALRCVPAHQLAAVRQPVQFLNQRNLWTGHQHGGQRYWDQRDRRRPRPATLSHGALLRKLASATLIAGSRSNSFLIGEPFRSRPSQCAVAGLFMPVTTSAEKSRKGQVHRRVSADSGRLPSSIDRMIFPCPSPEPSRPRHCKSHPHSPACVSIC